MTSLRTRRYSSALGLAALLACSTQSPGEDRELLVLGELPDAGAAAMEPLQPFTLESQAEVIAIGRVHEPVEQGGRRLLKLELTEVIKGGGEVRTIFPDDSQAFLGCILPERLPRPSELFPPGSEVLVYLNRDPEGLAILQLRPLPARRAPDLAQVRRYVEIEAALREPGADLSRLLPADAEPDLETYWAVYYSPSDSPEILSALRARLQYLAAAGAGEKGSHPETVSRALSLIRWGPALVGLLAEEAEAWATLLASFRGADDRDVLQGMLDTLARLPHGAGLRLLLEELEALHPARCGAAAWALTRWEILHRADLERRARARARIEAVIERGPFAPADYGDLDYRLRQLAMALR